MLVSGRLVDGIGDEPSTHHTLIERSYVARCRNIARTAGHRLAKRKRKRQPAIRGAALNEACEITVPNVPRSAVEKRSAGGSKVLQSIASPDDRMRNGLPCDAKAGTNVILECLL